MNKYKILMVDDDVDVINAVMPFMIKERFELVTASNKKEGMDKARTENPDLIILDVMMTTQFEGFELREELINNPLFKDVPVIMLTSIDVLTTNRHDVQAMAREFRRNDDYSELQVLLVKDLSTGNAGIDYMDENKNTHWLPVNGFIKKPVNPMEIMKEIKGLLK